MGRSNDKNNGRQLSLQEKVHALFAERHIDLRLEAFVKSVRGNITCLSH